MEQKSSEKAMTPKERYDAEMEAIKDANMAAKGKDPDEERELDAMTDDAEKIMDNMESREIDKTVGEAKEKIGPGPFSPVVDKATGQKRVEVTREQFEKHKADQQAQKALMALKNAQTEHLKPKDQKLMNCMVSDFAAGILVDPVIVHLMKEKVKISQAHVAASKEVNLLQRKMLQQVAEVTNNLVKTKGAMETTDRMILDRQKELSTDEKEIEKVI